MNPRSCANSYICLCMFVPLRVLTVRTSYVYIDILTNIHISYYRYFCVWLRVVRTHICLCPCECSQLEPLCIHTYVTSIHIFHHRYVCISTRAVQSHTCTCHCRCSHLEPLCIQIFTTISIHILYHEQFCI